MNKLRWFISILWRLPLTLLIAVIGLCIFAISLSEVKEIVHTEWNTYTKLPKLVEHYDLYHSGGDSNGIVIQSVALKDSYLIYYEDTENEYYEFTLNVPDDPNFPVSEVYSKKIPNDFANVALYRLKEDLSIYAIDPHYELNHSANILQFIVFGILLTALFAFVIGVFIERGVRVWKNHPALSGTAQPSKNLTHDSDQDEPEHATTYGWSTWFVWLSLLTLLSMTTIIFGWIDIPVTQREWRDLLLHTFVVAANLSMVIFYIEIFSAKKRLANGLDLNRHLMFFPSVVFLATFFTPLFAWIALLYQANGG